jgi:hypothetical protein
MMMMMMSERQPSWFSSPHLLVAALLVLSGTASAHAQSENSAAGRAEPIVVLDTLGAATPRTTFSIFGSAGPSIFGNQWVGPEFTLTRRSVLIKVGAFINNCGAFAAGGVPQCANRRPIVVQIRRSLNGAPDPVFLVAATPLSSSNDPLTYSFESADFDDVVLEPGTYFAIFSPQQAGDGGTLLGVANNGAYVAGLTTIGFVSSSGSPTEQNFVAVRIVAKPVKARPRHDDGAASEVGR